LLVAAFVAALGLARVGSALAADAREPLYDLAGEGADVLRDRGWLVVFWALSAIAAGAVISLLISHSDQ
jgi:hypothetical protein